MLTRDDIRRMALAMPEAYEASHFDVADFRVNKKIFCTLPPSEPTLVLKLDPEDQHNLLDGDAIQKVAGSWGDKGWTCVYFERLKAEPLGSLMRLAWATVAPKRLLKG